MLLFCIFWYTVDPYWHIFSGQKLDFKIFSFSPIIKSMISLYNLKKDGEARFSTGKFYFLAVASYMAYTAIVVVEQGFWSMCVK